MTSTIITPPAASKPATSKPKAGTGRKQTNGASARIRRSSGPASPPKTGADTKAAAPKAAAAPATAKDKSIATKPAADTKAAAPKAATVPAATTSKSLTALGAARQVLLAATGPMKMADIVKAILDGNLTTLNGKTPGATIAARIYVDAKHLPEKRTFVKVDRGILDLHELNPEGAKQRPKTPLHTIDELPAKVASPATPEASAPAGDVAPAA